MVNFQQKNNITCSNLLSYKIVVYGVTTRSSEEYIEVLRGFRITPTYNAIKQ